MPASPANVSGSPPSATPSRASSARPAGDQRGLRVVAVAEAVGDAGADREHVLQRARHLAADDIGVRVHAERRREEQPLQLVGDRRRRRTATTDAVGWPAATSRARFGPVSTPMRVGVVIGEHLARSPRSCARSVPCSMPLARLTIAALGADVRARVGEHRAQAVRRHRRTRRRRRRRTPRLERSAVARSAVGKRDAGEVVGVLVLARRCCAASSARRAHSVVGALPADDRGDRRPPRPRADHRDVASRGPPVRARRSRDRATTTRPRPARALRVDLARARDALADRRP